jgi:outer membrane protein assembly factor BamB
MRWRRGRLEAKIVRVRVRISALWLLITALITLAVVTSPARADAGGSSVAYQLDPAHDGYASGVSLAPPLTKAWTQTLSGAVSYPLVVGDAVYVSAGASTGTNVYALSRTTGSILWEHAVGSTYPWSGIAYDVTGAGGRIFVINSDGLLTALDAGTGGAVWSTKLPGQYSFSSPPTAVNGIVYVGGAGSGGTLYATYESTGALLWSQPVANGDNSSPAVDGSNVYVTYPDNYYAFNRTTGVPVWHDYLDGDGGGGRTPVVADGHLFIRDWAGSPLIASSATGATQGPLGSTTVPAIADGTAYEMTGALGSGTLQAVGQDGLGATQWSFAGDGHLASAPVVTSNAVWVGSTSGEIYALGCASGAPQWSTNVGSPIYAPDEQNVSQPLTGLGVGGNTLVVPAGSTLVAYTSSSTAGAGSCGTFTGSGSRGTSVGSAGTQLSSTTTPGATHQPAQSLRIREATLLRRELLLHTTVKRLLARHRITLKVAALAAGRLTFAWIFAPAGRRTAHPMRVTVAIRVKRAGTAQLTLRLGAAVMRSLRQARHGFTVSGTATFTPKSGRSVIVERSFRMAA